MQDIFQKHKDLKETNESEIHFMQSRFVNCWSSLLELLVIALIYLVLVKKHLSDFLLYFGQCIYPTSGLSLVLPTRPTR